LEPTIKEAKKISPKATVKVTLPGRPKMPSHLINTAKSISNIITILSSPERAPHEGLKQIVNGSPVSIKHSTPKIIRVSSSQKKIVSTVKLVSDSSTPRTPKLKTELKTRTTQKTILSAFNKNTSSKDKTSAGVGSSNDMQAQQALVVDETSTRLTVERAPSPRKKLKVTMVEKSSHFESEGKSTKTSLFSLFKGTGTKRLGMRR
jgi:hypothetical protein